LKLLQVAKLVAGGGMLVVLGAAALMLWPLLWPPDPDASVQLVNGRLVGETSGYVGRIDRDARTIDVSPSLVGWRPIVLIVNESTAIMVQNRQGGFGDLWKDMPVRVSYEVVGDARLARAIEVVGGEGDSPQAAVVNGSVTQPAVPAPALLPPSAAAVAPAGAAPAASPPTPQLRAVEPAPSPTSGPPAAQPVTPSPATSMPTTVSPGRVEPPLVSTSRRVEPPKADGPRRIEPPAAESPRRVDPPAGEIPRRTEPVAEPPRRVEGAAPPPSPSQAPSPARAGRPAEAEPDGAAAIDWLLQERGRR
jgi:hypothetical protein